MTSSRASATARSGSSFRRSICCRVRRRCTTWNCRSSTPVYRRRSAEGARQSCSSASVWPTACSTAPRSCRADNGSASRSHARSSTGRRSCWPMSRPAISTAARAVRSWRSLMRCRRRGRRSSSSHTRATTRDVRNALAQAEADLEVARARLLTAEAQKKRSTELRAANVITEQEFESAAFEEANARAQFVKARTNLELAQERMSDVTIRAPIDGVIIRKDVEEGQIIQSASQNISGGTTVLLMADLSQMQVRALVNETDLGKIQPGMTARVAVEAFPGRTFEGTVLKIEPQAVVEQNVTMFPVLVQLENRDGALKPGMNAEVIVEVARRDNVV